MCLMIYIAKAFLCDGAVELRRGKFPVPEQLLDAAQVGTTIEQMGRKAVAETVRTGRIHQTGSTQVSLQEASDAPRGQAGAALIEEECRLPGKPGLSQGDPAAHAIRRPLADRTKPLAPTLAADPNQLLLYVQVLQVQTHQLADPQAAPIEGLQQGAIPDPRRGLHRDRL